MTEVTRYTFEGSPFGEGFFADRVVKEKNVELGANYFSLLREAELVDDRMVENESI